MILAFLPCLAQVNWFNLGFSALGVLFGIYAVAATRARTGAPIVGLVLCLMVLSISVARLIYGATTL
jgi:hypothetical protein